MFQHYLKIAIRNLWKYKSQTLISVIGLAVGLICFALAALWIRYEMTFDSFHKKAGQMYVVYKPDVYNPGSYTKSTGYMMSSYLKEIFPEIVDAIPITSAFFKGKVTVAGIDFPVLTIRADSSIFRLFDVKILEGSQDFLIPGSNKIAITQKKAVKYLVIANR